MYLIIYIIPSPSNEVPVHFQISSAPVQQALSEAMDPWANMQMYPVRPVSPVRTGANTPVDPWANVQQYIHPVRPVRPVRRLCLHNRRPSICTTIPCVGKKYIP